MFQFAGKTFEMPLMLDELQDVLGAPSWEGSTPSITQPPGEPTKHLCWAGLGVYAALEHDSEVGAIWAVLSPDEAKPPEPANMIPAPHITVNGIRIAAGATDEQIRAAGFKQSKSIKSFWSFSDGPVNVWLLKTPDKPVRHVAFIWLDLIPRTQQPRADP